MKKFIIFMLYLIVFTLILPCNVNALEYNENYGNIYVLTDTTTSTMSSQEAEKIVGSTNVCDEKNSMKKTFRKYWKMIMVFAPALVILMTSIDFFKAITSSDSDKLKKSANNAFKRVLAFVLLLFLPFILNTIFSWIGLDLCL